MTQHVPFAEALEVVEQLSLDDKLALVDILNRRLAEEGRKRILADVRESRDEHQSGKCAPITTDDLMREILS